MAPHRLLERWLRALLFASLVATATSPTPAAAQTADVNAEARVFFEQGNRHFADAMRRRGQRRGNLLDEALQAYVSSLRIVRSRNALFNAAAVLEELGRQNEAFAYYTEYLAIPGLSAQERESGETRLGALRPQVAVLSIQSAPAGAQVFVDRLDLAPRGMTPLELALPAGEHTIYFRLEGHDDAETRATAVVGRTVTTQGELSAAPRPLVVAAPEGGRLTLDGEVVPRTGATITPGPHTLRYQADDTVEQAFVVEAGTGPVQVAIRAAAAPTAGRGEVLVRSGLAAAVSIDGVPIGEGPEVRTFTAPGDHVLVVEVPGYAPYRQRIEVDADSLATVDVEMVALSTDSTLGTAPAWMGLGTVAVGAVWMGLSIRAIMATSDADDFIQLNCTDGVCGDPTGADDIIDATTALAIDKRDDADDANLLADVFLGVTAAMTLTTIILFIIDEPLDQERSGATISVAPLRGGAMVGASFALEGL